MHIHVLLTLAVALAIVAGCNPAVENGAPASPAAGRPADARSFGGHWYKAFDKKVTWQQAKRLCEQMGGYLACIDSPDEQEFVAALADGRYLYLGGTDETNEGLWTWINDDDFVYTCWMFGQPNNYGGNENYLATYDKGEWVDVAAEGDGFWMPTGFLCEWDD